MSAKIYTANGAWVRRLRVFMERKEGEKSGKEVRGILYYAILYWALLDEQYKPQ
jgi:hypothetical protein